MRCAIAWLIDGLPFDPRSRRALDETMLDWAHEQRNAPTLGRRVLVQLRAAVAIARAVASAVVGDIVRTPWMPLTFRALVVLVTPLVAITCYSYAVFWPDLRLAAGMPTAVELSALQS